MIEFIRQHQLSMMLSLSSICAIVSLFIVLTGVSGRKKKSLLLLEIGAAILLISDRATYIFEGNTTALGLWMERINTFLDYFMTIVVVFAFNQYLKEFFLESEELDPNLKRFKLNDVLLAIGALLIVISQFTGLYYTFDDNNHYQRGPGVVLCFIMPLAVLSIQLSLIIQYYKRLSKNMRLSVLCFAIIPFPAAIVQFLVYGVETTNMTIVGMAVLLYIFDLININRTADISRRAIAANEAKSTFLSNMLHEIRTPINAMLGMNEMILRECEDANILSYSENIKTAGNTLLGLINDILDFSKIEAGKIEIIPVDYDISSLINDLVNMVHTRADDKGLILKLDFDKNIPQLLNGDEIRIKQVITNILTNAVKYTERGSVTFSMGYEKIENDPDSIMLNVSVKDTGMGIKEEDMKKLFSEFERLEEERNHDIEGTGLGMSITKSLLDMMGSSLQVESTYGEGSRFFFSLKQRVVAWNALGDYEASYREHISKRKQFKERLMAPDAKILVVDDNEMNIVVFTSLIKQTAIKADTAESGNKALRLMKTAKYDIIFLDHMMPGKNGVETLHEMKAQAGNPNHDTPVICLTANAISGAREQYISEGFDDYLTKPVSPERLEEVIIYYLPKEKVKMISEDINDKSKDSEKPEEYSADAEWKKVIDEDIGIRNNGSREAYMSILRLFYDSIEGKIEELDHYYLEKDIENYTISVHALKSSAKIIGAMDLGEKAQALEYAGGDGDTTYIKGHHSEFVDECMKLKVLLSGLFVSEDEDDGRPEANDILITMAIEEIKSAAEDMDCDRLNNVFGELEEYSIPKSRRELFDKLKVMSEQYDYRNIMDLLSQIGIDA